MTEKVIHQTVFFEGVKSQELYTTYMDSAAHTEAVNAPVKIEPRIGGNFSAFREGNLVGKILHFIPERAIVQTWRSLTQWKENEPDSILVLAFMQTPQGAELTLLQVGVPDRHFDLFNEGWHERYWDQWQSYFKRKK